MLSIVICSVNKAYLDAVTQNIADTVGVPYELLVWDNRGKNEGLCTVYNKMAARAVFPYICFCHEDILFGTNNWGGYLVGIFGAQPRTAMIGVAGAQYKSRMFSGWHTGIAGIDYYKIYHEEHGQLITLQDNSDWKGDTEKVACIDGVFMTCRKEAWEENKFNESLLKGFHFYDLDFSLRMSQQKDVVVTRNIHITHITVGGDYGEQWLRQAIVFHEAHAAQLPAGTAPASIPDPELKIAATWLDRLKKERISTGTKWRWIRLQGLQRYPSLWYGIAKFLCYRPLGLERIHHLIKGRK